MNNNGSEDPIQDTFRHLESDWHYLLKVDEERGTPREHLDAEQNQALERLSRTALLEESSEPGFILTEPGRKMKDTVKDIINLTRYKNSRTSVLAIEDDPNMANMLERWMEDELDYKIVGSDEYNSEINAEIDVVVIERFLNKGNLEDIIGQIKSKWPEKPVITLLGVDPELEGKDFGEDEYMVKPVDKEEFIQKIRDVKNR